MNLRPLFFLLPILVFTACQKEDPRFEAEDERNPLFEEAQKAIHDRDFEKAVKSYESALRKNPKVAAAHYEIGMLYSERLGDPVKAIYHLQRFLDERPNTDKAEMAKGHLENAKITFAATLPNSPVQNAELFAKIQADNISLKKEREELYKKVSELEGALSSEKESHTKAIALLEEEKAKLTQSLNEAQKIASVAVTAPTAVASPVVNPVIPNTPTPSPSATSQAQNALAVTSAPSQALSSPTPAAVVPSEVRSYTITKGDTLWKISKKFYSKDVVNGIDRIKKANPEALPEGKPLKIGTVITIP